MAQIVAKAFDATKRIVRSVFLGSPNLFTTSDVNRQIEAFKYQIDQLDDKVGVLSDISWGVEDLGSLNYKITPTFTYLKVKGCDFTSLITDTPLDVTLVADKPLYVCLFGQTEVVTYADDATHEIAGAKFADNSSAPAANQVRYKASTVHIGTSSSPNTESDLVAILMVMEHSSDYSDTTYTIKKNTVKEGESSLLKSSEQLEFIREDNTDLHIGDVFSTVASKLRTLCRNTAQALSTLSDLCDTRYEEVKALINKNRTPSDILRVDITSTTSLEGAGIGCVAVEGLNKFYFKYDSYHPNCPYRLNLYYDSDLPRVFAFQDVVPVIENDAKQYSVASPLVHFKEGGITVQIMLYLNQSKYNALYSNGKRYIKWSTNTLDIYGYSMTPGVVTYAEMHRVNILSFSISRETLNSGSWQHIILDYNVDFTASQA